MTYLSYNSRSQRVKNKNNISIDRINSNEHYVLDNIQLICSFVNTIKWDMPMKEFVEFCCLISERYNSGKLIL